MHGINCQKASEQSAYLSEFGEKGPQYFIHYLYISWEKKLLISQYINIPQSGFVIKSKRCCNIIIRF